MARPDKDGKSDTSNLYQVRGSGEQHFPLPPLFKIRLNYCDSKWNAGDYPDNNIFLRIYTEEENLEFQQTQILK